MNGEECGIVRDMDPTNPEGTNISRHCRRRFMEWTAKKKVTQNTVDWIKEYSNELNTLIDEDGLGGAQSIDVFPNMMKGNFTTSLTGIYYNISNNKYNVDLGTVISTASCLR